MVKDPPSGADEATASGSLFAGYLKTMVAPLSYTVSEIEVNDVPVIRLSVYKVKTILAESVNVLVSTPNSSYMTRLHVTVEPTTLLK